MTTARIRLNPGAITAVLGLAIVLLALAHLALQSVKYHLGLPYVYGLVQLFDMGLEANLPTFFSSFQLILASLVLAAIGLVKRRRREPMSRHWLVLALIMFLLSADEMSEIHEMSIRPIKELAPGLVTGLFYWAWVIPAAILVVVVSVSYANFVFRHLPGETRNTTIVGAALFVGGAIGVEMPEARFVEHHGLDNFTYAMFVLVEETMEMTGILVFLSGMLRYFGREIGAVAVEVAASPATERQASRIAGTTGLPEVMPAATAATAASGASAASALSTPPGTSN